MKLSLLFFGIIIGLCNGKQRIAGGQLRTVQDHPYIAAFLTNNGEGSIYSYACSGIILTNNALLSAASCFVDGNTVHPVAWWRARVGSSFSNAGGNVVILNSITPHPNYNPTILDSNLAVLRTRDAITFVPGQVEQAFLSGLNYAYSLNRPVQAIGWGAQALGDSPDTWQEQLQQVQIWLGDQQTCSNRYAALGITVNDNMVCAGWLDVGIRGQCEGDVGAPLVDNGVVVGLYSHAQGCADYWFLGINTRVARFTSWIVSTARAA